ncbi:appr-1-p processing domain-containing protein [Janibacter hoylei PVAS-1]|uniref:Appr-1-p processing domain-containing protein n=1 Tax=Janibacter hoylei PVAS-1 TaxID=1210046 RepID=K1DZW4_9MICO|nr:appr-1-p processing domain-containing protein [Janibacter hoylei PVAS-1]
MGESTGAIHRAGGPAVLEDCIARFPRGLATGDAGWTTAGDLPSRWVIHTVGPNHAAGQRDRSLLVSCYRRCLEVADELGGALGRLPARQRRHLRLAQGRRDRRSGGDDPVGTDGRRGGAHRRLRRGHLRTGGKKCKVQLKWWTWHSAATSRRTTPATPRTSRTGSPRTGRATGRSSRGATASSSPGPARGPTARSSCAGSSASRTSSRWASPARRTTPTAGPSTSTRTTSTRSCRSRASRTPTSPASPTTRRGSPSLRWSTCRAARS